MPVNPEDMIQLLMKTNAEQEERLKEKDQTISDLRSTVEELRGTVADLRSTKYESFVELVKCKRA